MPFVRMHMIKRADIRKHRDWLYVFGDNFYGVGFGGQARQCRGEYNAVGIPTKRKPYMYAEAFLTDADLDEWRKRSAPAFARIEAALARGETVVLPSAGVGTGLAQLEQRAPAIWRELNQRLLDLEARH